jgi:polyhydroxyalkanoate synthesis regulator phasin
MALNDFVQKAVYLGIGAVSYAGEKVSETLNDLPAVPDQLRKLADEMVSKGEMTADEARKALDEMVRRAQQQTGGPTSDVPKPQPRNIEISDEDESPEQVIVKSDVKANSDDIDVADMRRQVQDLQDELRRLRK